MKISKDTTSWEEDAAGLRSPNTWPEACAQKPREFLGESRAHVSEEPGAWCDSVRFPSHAHAGACPYPPVLSKNKVEGDGFLTERGLHQPRPRWWGAGGRGLPGAMVSWLRGSDCASPAYRPRFSQLSPLALLAMFCLELAPFPYCRRQPC